MPAVSAKQRTAMAIAEHNPSQLYKRNKAMLQMTHGQLHDFASTKGLGRTNPSRTPIPATRFRLVRATGVGTQRNKML
jgi:hypothetical protein